MNLLCFIIIIWRNDFLFSHNQVTKRMFSQVGFSKNRFEMDICLWEIYQKMLSGTIHVKKKGKQNWMRKGLNCEAIARDLSISCGEL